MSHWSSSRIWISVIAVSLASVSGLLRAEDVKLTDAEQAFIKQLSNRVMVGHFTVDGRDEGGKVEKYTIGKVSKFDGDQWTVEARIQYGKVDATVPVPVHVHWAGDTPVLSVTNLTLPLVGSEFSARVLFDGDRYAGTWKHGQAGGHMWGRLEDAPPATDGAAPAK